MTPVTEARIRAAVAELADAIIEAARGEAARGPDKLLSIPEAAEALGVGRTTVYSEIAAGHLRRLKIGRRVVIPASSVDDYIAAR